MQLQTSKEGNVFLERGVYYVLITNLREVSVTYPLFFAFYIRDNSLNRILRFDVLLCSLYLSLGLGVVTIMGILSGCVTNCRCAFMLFILKCFTCIS